MFHNTQRSPKSFITKHPRTIRRCFGGPSRTRTCNLGLRTPLLYPVELSGQNNDTKSYSIFPLLSTMVEYHYMARRTTRVKPGSERLNAMITLELWMVGAWLCVIFFTGLKRDLFLHLQEIIQSTTTPITWGGLFVSIVLAIAIFLILYKQHLLGNFAAILLGFLGFTGAVLYLGAEISFFLAVCLILYERMHHGFLSNNLLIAFAVVFGSIPIGISYGPEPLILALLFFSIYDIGGVFLTRFIPHLARRSVEYRIPLLLIAPKAHIKWTDRPTLTASASILGAGDLFLPAFFIASVTVFVSVPAALLVLLGALLGAIGNTILASLIRTGIPAIPLMTIGMITAFYLFL